MSITAADDITHEDYPTAAITIREGDKVRFSREECTAAFPHHGPQFLPETVEGVVLMITQGIRPYPDEVCLSLPQGNFWFFNHTTVIYAGQATDEELDYEYTATYGERYPR